MPNGLITTINMLGINNNHFVNEDFTFKYHSPDPIPVIENFETVINLVRLKLLEQQHNLMRVGSTLVCAAITKNKIKFANIGDSSLFVLRKVDLNWTCFRLNEHHTINLPAEKARVISKGGSITEGRSYIWNESGRGLAMSRSLADYSHKDLGVIDTPDIDERPLLDSDLILITSDFIDAPTQSLEDTQSCIARIANQHLTADINPQALKEFINHLYEATRDIWLKKRNSTDDATLMLIKPGDTGVIYAGVCDGHGGTTVAKWVSSQLIRLMKNAVREYGVNKHLSIAQECKLENRREAEIQAYLNVIEADPHHCQANLRLADLYHEQSDIDNEIKFCLNIYKGNEEVTLRLAKRYLEQKSYVKAIKYCHLITKGLRCRRRKYSSARNIAVAYQILMKSHLCLNQKKATIESYLDLVELSQHDATKDDYELYLSARSGFFNEEKDCANIVRMALKLKKHKCDNVDFTAGEISLIKNARVILLQGFEDRFRKILSPPVKSSSHVDTVRYGLTSLQVEMSSYELADLPKYSELLRSLLNLIQQLGAEYYPNIKPSILSRIVLNAAAKLISGSSIWFKYHVNEKYHMITNVLLQVQSVFDERELAGANIIDMLTHQCIIDGKRTDLFYAISCSRWTKQADTSNFIYKQFIIELNAHRDGLGEFVNRSLSIASHGERSSKQSQCGARS